MILRSILALTGLSTPFAASQMYVPLSCRLTFGSDSRLPELCFSPEGSIWYCKTKAKHTINFIIHCCFSSSIRPAELSNFPHANFHWLPTPKQYFPHKNKTDIGFLLWFWKKNHITTTQQCYCSSMLFAGLFFFNFSSWTLQFERVIYELSMYIHS